MGRYRCDNEFENPMRRQHPSEGFAFARLMMVLSSLSPLFALWAVRGIAVVPDKILVPVCVGLAVLPNLFLRFRIRTAARSKDTKVLTVKNATDNREHLLVYLFAMLIPLYDANLGTPRDALATLCAFAFVVFLFWHMNLHYMNVFLAIRGYHVFTLRPAAGVNARHENVMVLISPRHHLTDGEEVQALRLSDTVYFEPKGGV